MSDPSESDFCCPPDCCDMRGMLTFQILWELRDQELNGQQIAERIAERRGSKPTPGTIYPALKELKSKRLIKGRKKGRQVIYSLTPAGEKGVKAAAVYFVQAFGDIVDEIKVKVIAVEGRCAEGSDESEVRVVVVDGRNHE